jgi:hypothetical protein
LDASCHGERQFSRRFPRCGVALELYGTELTGAIDLLYAHSSFVLEAIRTNDRLKTEDLGMYVTYEAES